VKKIIFAIFCLIAFEAHAQKVADTTKKKVADTVKKDLLTAPDTVKKLHSNPKSLIAPFGLVVYGASSFFIHPVRRFDYYIFGDVKKTGANFHTKAESYFQFAPIVMVYGLNMVGVAGKNVFIDRTALLGLSAGLLGASEGITKKLSHRLRPNNNDYLSFPSGHTGIAFMGAEFMAQEYSSKSFVYSVIGYTFAATTGVFRLYNRDHWFSDVVAGAGYGILSTKLSYLIYPYIRHALTPKGKDGRSTMVMPTYQDGVPALSFAMQL
jgi:membrane-associated phospholipid phosphatase